MKNYGITQFLGDFGRFQKIVYIFADLPLFWKIAAIPGNFFCRIWKIIEILRILSFFQRMNEFWANFIKLSDFIESFFKDDPGK